MLSLSFSQNNFTYFPYFMKSTAIGTNGSAENAANLAGMVRGSATEDTLVHLMVNIMVAPALGT